MRKNQPICLTCLVSSCIIQAGRISFPVLSFMEMFLAINILNRANACICQCIMMRRMNHWRMFRSRSLSASQSDLFFLSFSLSLFLCFSSHFVIACHDQRQGKWVNGWDPLWPVSEECFFSPLLVPLRLQY